MARERPHTSVNISQKSDNRMAGVLGGEYELPYPMRHMLEIEAWVDYFRPIGLYDEVEDAINPRDSVAKEGEKRACESCGSVQECGFNYDRYFSDDEYLRILSQSGACSLECAVEYAFHGKFAPSISEFKSNPDAYKTLGLVNTTTDEIRQEFYSDLM